MTSLYFLVTQQSLRDLTHRKAAASLPGVENVFMPSADVSSLGPDTLILSPQPALPLSTNGYDYTILVVMQNPSSLLVRDADGKHSGLRGKQM